MKKSFCLNALLGFPKAQWHAQIDSGYCLLTGDHSPQQQATAVDVADDGTVVAHGRVAFGDSSGLDPANQLVWIVGT